MTTRSGYASTTSVPVSRSTAEIEEQVLRFGATDFARSRSSSGLASVMFTVQSRTVRFDIQLPDPKEQQFTHTDKGKPIPQDQQRRKLEQAERSAWRELCLSIKAKLVAVAAGISTFEREFLANVVLPDGTLVGDRIAPVIEAAYKSQQMPRLLLGSGEK